MCGILGEYRFEDALDPIINEQHLALLQHRGPDNQSLIHLDHISLGHVRLSIIDTSQAANQPMSSDDQRYHLIFNGEVFNYRSIRSQLQNNGFNFSTESDTEVVLKWLMYKGIEGLSDFNGFFALAFFDSVKKEIFIARDPMGIKPLYWKRDEDRLTFCSEHAPLAATLKKHNMDNVSLGAYLQLNYIPSPKTIDQQINKLKPGHYISVKGQHQEIMNYSEDRVLKKSELTYDNARDQLKSLMEEAVKLRLVSDVPLGTFLSGGLDSSIIATIAAKYQRDLNSFSISFGENSFFDESNYAKMVARKAGTHHRTIVMSEEEMLGHIDDFLLAIDEPFADSSALAYYLLTKKTSEHVTVALSGDGADEVFAGYNKYRAFYRVFNQKLSDTLVKSALPILKKLPQSRHSKWGNKSRQITRYSEGLNLNSLDRYWRWSSFTSKKEIQNILRNPQLEDTQSYLYELAKDKRFENMNEVLLMDQNLVLVNDMLYKADKMSMANSLEVRVPFLDKNVVDFARSLPVDYIINENYGKRILRDAFKDDLPPEIFSRSKKGFEVPLAKWFNGSLNSRMLDLLSPELTGDQGIFKESSIADLRKKLSQKSVTNEVHLLWALFIFQNYWLRKNQ